MVLPAITQLPLFIFSTALFSSIATRPTPLDDESFLTLTSLAKSDPTGTLPVALGLTTLANVETAGWLTSAERAARNKELEERQEEEEHYVIHHASVLHVLPLPDWAEPHRQLCGVATRHRLPLSSSPDRALAPQSSDVVQV